METKDEKVARLLKRPSSVTGAPLGLALGFFLKMAFGPCKVAVFPRCASHKANYHVRSITLPYFPQKPELALQQDPWIFVQPQKKVRFKPSGVLVS